MANDDTMDLSVKWWLFPPYTNRTPNSTVSPVGGIFGTAFQEMLAFCNIKTSPQHSNISEVANPTEFDGELAHENPNNSLSIFMPFSRSVGMTSYMDPELYFLPVIESPGGVYIYREGSKPVGSDLVTVIIEGWPMIILILLGAAYAGIIIWILDRLWNPTNFPKPFIRGFWEGFWWAFVTMTTVGYGDTTPRSIQARVFGLVWIIIGITILSVFTATVTTVMTQEAVSILQNLENQKIVAVNGTEDLNLAVSKGAIVIISNTITEMFSFLHETQQSLSGALLDYYSLMTHLNNMPHLSVEGTIQHKVLHGFLVRGGDKKISSCLSRYVNANRKILFTRLTKTIHPPKLHIAAQKAQGLFQQKTINYMFYSLAVWVFIFLLFVMWEFVYWRPKHKRKKLARRETERRKAEEDNQPAAENLQELKIEKPVQNGTIPNHTNIPNITVSHTNGGFDNESTSSNSNFASYKKDHMQLDLLVQRQNTELLSLEEEYKLYKRDWERRVKLTRARHHQEQLELYQSVQNLRVDQRDHLCQRRTSDTYLFQQNKPTAFNTNSFKLKRKDITNDILRDTINYL